MKLGDGQRRRSTEPEPEITVSAGESGQQGRPATPAVGSRVTGQVVKPATIARALVISGGGSKIFHHAGALQAAFAQFPELRFDYIAGVSAGALLGGPIAQSSLGAGQRRRLDRIVEELLEIRGHGDVLEGSTWLPLQLWNLWRRGYLYDPAPLARMLARHLDPKVLAESGTVFQCGVTELESGAYFQADGRFPKILEKILASASMPIYFPPVVEGGSHLLDGGLRNQTPLRSAVHWLRRQPVERRELWVFLANPLELGPVTRHPWKAPAVFARSLGIVTHEIYLNDLALLFERNHVETYATIAASVVAPEVELGPALNFDPKRLKAMYLAGRAAMVAPPAPTPLPLRLERAIVRQR